MMKMRRISKMLFGVIFLTFLFSTTVFAINYYSINGVTVSYNDFSSSPNECWVYANALYRKIWGVNFNNQFDHESNSLRNLSDSELTLTPEHLKAYVSNAALGACLRVCDKQYLHGSDGWGHSQIIVQKDENGFTVLQGGLTAYPHKNEQYYTWDGYCYSRWPGKYQYIKYIKWPNAKPYVKDNEGPVISDVVVQADCMGYTITCKVSDESDIAKVLFPAWTSLNGQDDLDDMWNTNDSVNGQLKDGLYTYRVDVQNHNYEYGEYILHIYAYDVHGNHTILPVSVDLDEEKLNHIWNKRYSLDKTPTIEEEGQKSYHCSMCDIQNPESIQSIEKLEAGTMNFEDVSYLDYFINPVIWASNNGVTSGVTESLFNPKGECTRAQAVTFLYRVMGNPEYTMDECPFDDVMSHKYYYDAVLWAVENGITAGTDEAHFSPDSTVTRAQFISFLWRLESNPIIEADNPFADVNEDAYYYNAVLWAVNEGITAGTDAAHFTPASSCNRAQVVSFLYRAYK